MKLQDYQFSLFPNNLMLLKGKLYCECSICPHFTSAYYTWWL